MARSFDGTNDNIQFGSDASIDGFTAQTVSIWINTTATGLILAKDQQSRWRLLVTAALLLRWDRDWTTTDGVWTSTNAIPVGAPVHVAVTYDSSASTNDPIFYINGALETTIEGTAPAGTPPISDADRSMFEGESGAGGADFNGLHANLSYVNEIWTAAQINRAMWWGRPGGAQAVYHPYFTTKTANEGTAVAAATVTGAVMASLPRVERCHMSMMGCGR